MKLAAIQHDIAWGDRDANLTRYLEFVDAAAEAGADLVVFSETFAVGFGFGTDGFPTEPEGGPTSTWMSQAAQRAGVWIAGSVPEIANDMSSDDQRPSNTLVFAAPDGTQVRYRKIHPFSFAGEDLVVRAGHDVISVDVAGVRITPFVCYDLRFTTEFWDAALTTDLYLVVANWPASRREHWNTLLRARAIENQAYVVGVNRVGQGNGLDYSGDTAVIDPAGVVVESVGDTEQIVIVDIDPNRVIEVRRSFPFLADRRTT